MRSLIQHLKSAKDHLDNAIRSADYSELLDAHEEVTKALLQAEFVSALLYRIVSKVNKALNSGEDPLLIAIAEECRDIMEAVKGR